MSQTQTEFHGVPWNISMEFHGIPYPKPRQNSVELDGKFSMELHGNLRNFMGFILHG